MMGHEEKVTFMVIDVDLQCSKCYSKIKKVLCKFPEVRDQVYDEKANKVIIKVVCCSPEKIRDKICSKGGRSIKGIEIKKPEKPKPAAPKEEDKKKSTAAAPKDNKDKEAAAKPPKEKSDEKAAGNQDKPKQHLMPAPSSAIPMFYPPPIMDGGAGYTTGVPAGQFYRGGGVVHYDGYYGRPVYDSWSGYENNDQPAACSIM